MRGPSWHPQIFGCFLLVQCQSWVADLFWWLAKLRAYVNDYWSIPASTCRETGAKARAAMHPCLSTTDFCPKLKIQFSFMELQILRLIKFSSCRQSFACFPPLVIHGVEKQSPSSLLSLVHSSSSPSFSCWRRRFQNERHVKRGKKKSVRKMTGGCQNNSPAIIFVQRSFNMVTEMHIQYSWDRSQELLRWVSCASWWLTGL